MKIDFKALAAPLPPDRVSWRVGATTADKTRGMALAYLDSRDVQERLDAVCGPEGWQCAYPHAGQKTVCSIGILVEGQWIWKADGAGDTDVEQEKGALSDAFKRAAVKWGIGRYLYDVVTPWVALEKKGNSYVIAEGEYAKLRKVLGGAPVKNAPGISEASAWVRGYLAEMKSVENAEQFMELCTTSRVRWARIRALYPNLYQGDDGAGLRGEAMTIASIVSARDDKLGDRGYDTFLKEIEEAAKSVKE